MGLEIAAYFKKSKQSFDRFVLWKVDSDGSMKNGLPDEEHFGKLLKYRKWDVRA